MAYVPPVGQTTDPDIFLDNVKLADRLVNGPESTIPDRGGVPLDSWRQMMAKNDEIRQNLVPLSKQYMTLAAAQADIANIPDGSTTYVRSPDGGTLADEYINNGGTLETTGRVMPSGYAVEQISDTVQRLMTALHVMAEGGTSSGSDVDTSETVQNLMTGFNVLAESINNLSVGNQKNSSGLSGLVSSVQVCTEMLNTLAAEIVTPDGAAQYGYVAFSVPGTVNAGNGSFGTDTRYRRTGMIPVRKGDVVRLTVYTTSATAGHAAALYDSSGAYVGPLGIMCASYAAYQARYYQCEISQDGFVVANTLDQSASSSVDVTGAALTIEHRLRGRAADAVIKLTKSDLIPVRLDNGNINASSITQNGIVNYSTGLYSCTGGRLLFSGLPVASSPGQSSSLYNVVFYDAAKALIAYRPCILQFGLRYYS
ncbi:flagellar biosynthesis, cell-distal portion of basal-body rod [Klebsiella michiganensis]|uniref:Flagellar biosynthesis, cell-distal portion of basal-body rod n=1 Tax=Klebsiella michiganensis TaxID=1134687 RepID=A0A7H4PJY8_9ENTR|nr:flagellar biosynthesis, cell-distal portion of basal-body rod [Klebsiella michiganensis]